MIKTKEEIEEGLFYYRHLLSDLDIIGYTELLYIADPLLYLLQTKDKFYLMYTLEDRCITVNNVPKFKLNVLLTETSINNVINMLENKVDVQSTIFNETSKSRFRINSGEYGEKKVSFSDIEKNIPISDVFLNDPDIPNFIDLDKVLKEICNLRLSS